MKRLTVSGVMFVGAVLTAFALVACGGTAKTATGATVPAGVASGTEATATTVNVTLSDFKVQSDVSAVSAGEVTFHVQNTGSVVHEMVIAKTDLAPGKLPLLTADSQLEEGHVPGDVDEEQLDSPGEVSDIPAGATSSGTFTLQPGNYVLFCNLPGHYKMGMYAAFTVK